MARIDEKLEYRSDFPDQVFDSFSSSKPVVVINGNVEDQIQVGKELHYLVDLLVKKAVEGKKYDFVILYNAASKDMQFGDEAMHLPEKDLGMREDFKGLNISLAAENGGLNGGDQVAKLLDPDFVKSHAGADSDSSFFTILKKLATGYQGKTFLVIIDHGDDIFPDEANTPTGASHATFPSRLTDIVRNLKGSTGRNVIVLNNKGGIAGSLTKNLPQLTMPASTESEVKDVLAKVIKDPDKLIQATRFAVTLEICVLMDIVNKADTDVDELLSRLIELRTANIERMSGGVLKASMGWKDDEVALSREAKAYCDGVSKNFFERQGLVGNGVLLVGPPGTGKSVFPQYIASQIGVPFLRVESLSTDGLSGRSTEKLVAVFAAIEANKPCIVLIDEIDMLIPSGKGNAFRNDNDDQFRALFQAKIADDKAMSGVLFFGASNHPENIATPLMRSGRFGEVIAVLPPKTAEERIQVFRAVWNQLKSSLPQNDPTKFPKPSDEVLTILLQDLPDYITGGDFKRMIIDAIKKVESKNSKYANIWEALFFLKKDLMSGKYIKKADDFDSIVEMSLAKQTVNFDEDIDSGEPIEYSKDELRALALARMTASVAADLSHAADTQADLAAKKEALRAERERLTQMIDAGMEALGESGRELKKGFASLEAKRKEIDAQQERLDIEQAEFEAHIAEQRDIFGDLVERFRGDSVDKDRKLVEEIEGAIAEISAYNAVEIKSPEAVVARIDDMIFRVSKLKIGIFGIFTGKEPLDKIDAALKKERVRFEAVAKITTPNFKLPELPAMSSPQENIFFRTLERISATTAGRVTAAILGLTISAGAIWGVGSLLKDKPSASAESSDNKAEIINFSSLAEAIKEGYIVVSNGTYVPREGYDWAYSKSTFPKGDPRQFSVKGVRRHDIERTPSAPAPTPHLPYNSRIPSVKDPEEK